MPWREVGGWPPIARCHFQNNVHLFPNNVLNVKKIKAIKYYKKLITGLIRHPLEHYYKKKFLLRVEI